MPSNHQPPAIVYRPRSIVQLSLRPSSKEVERLKELRIVVLTKTGPVRLDLNVGPHANILKRRAITEPKALLSQPEPRAILE